MRRSWALISIGLIGIAVAWHIHQAKPPGIIVDYSPPASRQYVGCPSIAILPNGDFVSSHSLFGPGSSNDRTMVFRSQDHGRSWQRIANLKGQFWSTLFWHHGALYLMGTNKAFGQVAIRRSLDCGRSWTEPRDRKTGLLLSSGRFHSAPVPVVTWNGRIWRSMEDMRPSLRWPQDFRAFVMSAPAKADLLQADNWISSNRLAFNRAWLRAESPGWLEGNIVIAPAGRLLNILRIHSAPRYGIAALVRISDDGKHVRFDPRADFIQFPGGMSKFTIRYDPLTRRHWSLVNQVTNPTNPMQRNVVVLVSSRDLRKWRMEGTILRLTGDEQKVAAQYLDWQFDGPDIVAVSRTAWGNAHNFHDADYFTFHRIERFRRGPEQGG
jgi:hypothetical protein